MLYIALVATMYGRNCSNHSFKVNTSKVESLYLINIMIIFLPYSRFLWFLWSVGKHENLTLISTHLYIHMH